MFKTMVNLNEQLIISEIEAVLDSYPHHPYQQAFAIPELRQELVVYVLNHLPQAGMYVTQDQLWQHRQSCTARRLEIEKLVHQGIQDIFQQRSDWISHHIPQVVEAGREPSHWFG
ncbi:MAG: late competence development ComFB family protein [Gloeomargarita sp. SKYG116]|nr:late competence development ComFB family protein [Gloeomargarita sp. SKYG116]MCS7225847.1 late competence development ComFB family protein [Gloeomargarita sp. SKYB31]MDW8401747.1 late competence development ComFB family protein [Gloeomargarita sp. SKYGB_i_bin116]